MRSQDFHLVASGTFQVNALVSSRGMLGCVLKNVSSGLPGLKFPTGVVTCKCAPGGARGVVKLILIKYR